MITNTLKGGRRDNKRLFGYNSIGKDVQSIMLIRILHVWAFN